MLPISFFLFFVLCFGSVFTAWAVVFRDGYKSDVNLMVGVGGTGGGEAQMTK